MKLLADLNMNYKYEENQLMFVIEKYQTFVSGIIQQERIDEDIVCGKIENLCGFNKDTAAKVTTALLIITGKECKNTGTNCGDSNDKREDLEGENISRYAGRDVR